MNYRITELNSFKIIGKKYELTMSLMKNKGLAKKHWWDFNQNLKMYNIQLGKNWSKYAITERLDDRIYYFIAIPYNEYVPSNFIVCEIIKSHYLTYEHKGNIDLLSNSINYVFKEIIPKNNIIRKNSFAYFEKYDYRFKWNNENSIIDINVPIEYGM